MAKQNKPKAGKAPAKDPTPTPPGKGGDRLAPPGSQEKLAAVDIVESGRYIRTYSKAVHGPAFLAKAEEFCSPEQLGGPDEKGRARHKRDVVPSAKIAAVKVVWAEEVKDPVSKLREMKTLEQVFSKSSGPDFKEQALELSSEKNGTIFVV